MAFFILLVFLVSPFTYAAETLRSWTTVRKEQGLMVNYVASIVEAPDGAIWFGTAIGVSRFDGRSWTHHTPENGLPGFLVSHVHVDEEGSVWAASGEGYPTFTDPWLARLKDGVWESFKLPGQRTAVRQMTNVRTGGFCVTTRNGVFYFDKDRWRSITVEDGLASNSVTCMIEQSDGAVLAAHSRRRWGFLPVEEHAAVISIQIPGREGWIPHPLSADLKDVSISAVAQDPSGGLWFGTREEGIRVYTNGKWRSVTVDDGLPSNRITVLTITKKGEVWAGSTAGIGLLKDYRGTQWELFTERDVLPSDGVNAIVSMTDGSIWVGTRAGAARYADTGWVHHAGPFSGVRGPISIELSLNGDLWASTERGLFPYQAEAWQQSYTFDPPTPVIDLISCPDGSMWALTPRSVLRLTGDTWNAVDVQSQTLDWRDRFFAIAPRRNGGCWLGGRTGVYSFDGQNLERLDFDIDGRIRVLFEQSDGTLWIGGIRDLYRYREGVVTRVDEIETFGLTGPESIIETSVGDLWVAFMSGVWRLRKGEWQPLPEGRATGFEGTTSLFESSRGTIWLASRIEGAIHTDGKTWTRYGAKSGLPSSWVWDVTEDAEGNLWFATLAGLGCYLPDTAPPETELLDPPVKVAPLEPVIMRLAAQDSWLETPESELQFSWRIDGNDWSPFNTENRVLLERLRAGNHMFEVRSMDRQFNVDPTPAVVTFEVLAPVFRRPWFRALSGFSFVVLVLTSGAAIHRSRRLKLAQQQLIDELESELQEAHEMQMSLLPSGPVDGDRVKAAGRCIPANHVGGDYYSFDWMEGGDTFVFGAADVSGKAMKAAVRVMQLSGMYRYELRADRTPAQVLKGLHWSLLDHLDDASFVTGCLGSLNAKTGHVLLANSGHPYPIHLTPDGGLREIEMPSLPMGITLPSGVSHTVAEGELTLRTGDTLIFYTDGITDLQDAAGEFYGDERFFAVLKRLARKPPTELVDELMDELGRFKGKAAQTDDVTVVAVMWQEGV